MLSNTTHGTFNDSIIFLATVVFPEALPPHTPKYSIIYYFIQSYKIKNFELYCTS